MMRKSQSGENLRNEYPRQGGPLTVRGVRGRQDSAFEDQTEGWWSRVSKDVICGDVGEEGARFPGTQMPWAGMWVFL